MVSLFCGNWDGQPTTNCKQLKMAASSSCYAFTVKLNVQRARARYLTLLSCHARRSAPATPLPLHFSLKLDMKFLPIPFANCCKVAIVWLQAPFSIRLIFDWRIPHRVASCSCVRFCSTLAPINAQKTSYTVCMGSYFFQISRFALGVSCVYGNHSWYIILCLRRRNRICV